MAVENNKKYPNSLVPFQVISSLRHLETASVGSNDGKLLSVPRVRLPWEGTRNCQLVQLFPAKLKAACGLSLSESAHVLGRLRKGVASSTSPQINTTKWKGQTLRNNCYRPGLLLVTRA